MGKVDVFEVGCDRTEAVSGVFVGPDADEELSGFQLCADDGISGAMFFYFALWDAFAENFSFEAFYCVLRLSVVQDLAVADDGEPGAECANVFDDMGRQ